MRAASVGGAFTMNETCPACGGRGLVVDDPCPTCHGSGRGLSNRTISTRIPAGVKDGQRIRVRGKGANGEHGGPRGDLWVKVHVQPHRLFGRKGHNLTLTVPVSFDEAALGAEIKVPTLNGSPVTVKLPPGTPVRPHPARARQGRAAPRTATATCWSPSRSRSRPPSTPRHARPSRPTGPPPRAATCAATCSTESRR